ncbi:MAG: propionate--CoA ligase [Magnetococcales bacterium]|nr:propionate--CoA ligase [Magnetococcales bacterium]
MTPKEQYDALYERSVEEPDAFWLEQAQLVDWQRFPKQALQYEKPPFAYWYPDGQLNLCHNAVDRHLEARGNQTALIWVSTEVEREQRITYQALYRQVNEMAALLRNLGVGKGDRVLIYLPMIPETVVAMMATVRLGAVHSVVFGGFAAHSLASRIDDATPTVVMTADAGMRGGKVIPYKPLLDAALEHAQSARPQVVVVNRGLDPDLKMGEGDTDYHSAVAPLAGVEIPPEMVASSDPSYILYTSGTTGRPKGVQRDTGGHAVSMIASMKYIYGVGAGDVMFSGSDIGWVVGHSYIVYAPLLVGATTVVYEGIPIRPDPGIWWSMVEKYKVNCMFTSPTAIRVLKKSGPDYIKKYDFSSLRWLFLAGEPLDRQTHAWVSETLGKPVVDNYWQTETGWPILSNFAGLGLMETKFGSPCKPSLGYNIRLVDSQSGAQLGADVKGALMIQPPLPPGCMTTIYNNDDGFVETYFSRFDEPLYATFDYAMYDQDGYYFIMGRDDDVLTVAGYRMGTREIEEALCTHPAVAEAAVVGVKDEIKTQEVVAFVVLTGGLDNPGAESLRDVVSKEVGPIAKPRDLYVVSGVPKTRSGKVLRRAILAICEGRDPGDLPTIEDAAVLDVIREAVGTG